MCAVGEESDQYTDRDRKDDVVVVVVLYAYQYELHGIMWVYRYAPYQRPNFQQ